MKKGLHIRRLDADEPAFDIAARWRYDAFFAQDGITFEESRDALRAWMGGLGYETALLAEVDGQPAGCCLFVREEIDPKHDLTPWLAALYVAPEFRKLGIASALVRAIEQHARSVGCSELYLYTITAEPLYAKLGWAVRDRFDSNGEKFVLMAREM
ncbi:MAG: N-acetyltransferase [Rhodospirillum sp.]|jgi:GNAT superfamily N-acetyltransferase|nr:N-acetyltransferase [Rhodospirillum sp.]